MYNLYCIVDPHLSGASTSASGSKVYKLRGLILTKGYNALEHKRTFLSFINVQT